MCTENKNLRIFLLGGTNDATDIIKLIKSNFNDSYILTTTTTDYGAKLSEVSGSDETISKPLVKEEILDILNSDNFDYLIDATHPFASHITQTITEVSKITGIPLIRFERPRFDLNKVDTSHVYHVNSFSDAGKIIVEDLGLKNRNILHFAGANTMSEVLEYVDKNYFFPRILKVESSLKKCEDLGIASDHILAMNGVSSKEDNIFLIQKYDAAVIITKESGETGGLFEKISAANEIGINIVLVDRPEVPNLNESNVVDNFNELLIRLNS